MTCGNGGLPGVAGDSSPPARPASPTDSFYAMSDDEEGDYHTVTYKESGRGVKLLFSKSKVYIHPTPSSKDNVSGFMALLQQKGAPGRCSSSSDSSNSQSIASDLLLAWIPETQLGEAASVYVKVELSEGDSPPQQSYFVPPPPTLSVHLCSFGQSFAIPVSAIYSLLVRPPNLGWWFGSVVINTRAGDSFPALFFHDSECPSTIVQKKKYMKDNFDPFGESGQMFWGGDEVLRWLKRYVKIERCTAEPNVYLVDPSKEDSEGFGPQPTTSSATSMGHQHGSRGFTIGAAAGANRSGTHGPSKDAQMDVFTKYFKETSWNIMEKFSKVTTFTRNAANGALEYSRVPPQVRSLLRNPEVKTLQEEFDSARIYLARWAMGMAEQSERDRRHRIWTAQDVLEMEDTDVGEFELLGGGSSFSMEERRRPVTLEEWGTLFDPATGRLAVTVDEVKDKVFHGGLDPDDGVRKESWLFLLGVYDWHSTEAERNAQIASLRDAYLKLKGSWWERLVDLGGQGEEGEWWREQRSRIEKDVHRTDRHVPIFAGENIPHPDPESPFAEAGTNVHMEQMKDLLLTYNEYNKELGYVQGMSDLLAPIYAVIQDDAIAFWAFQHLMERMERNFLRDQSGMRSQLMALDQLVHFMDPKLWSHLDKADSTNFFFFFRMLLVCYKREFSWLDILRLWEVIWTDFQTSSFHLFVALAILEKHRDVIITYLHHFDEVLKYVNELSGTLDLESTLLRAEALFHKFKRLIEAIDKKSNFPAPHLTVSTAVPSLLAHRPTTPHTNSDKAGYKNNNQLENEGKQPEPKSLGEPERFISPELRRLLSRQVEVLSRTEVAKEREV